MSLTDFLNHVLNWLAPALWLAVLLPLAARLTLGKRPPVAPLWAQVAANFFIGMLLLGCGLWFFGNDGKMATYIGMTLACASTQWLMLAAWRK